GNCRRRALPAPGAAEVRPESGQAIRDSAPPRNSQDRPGTALQEAAVDEAEPKAILLRLSADGSSLVWMWRLPNLPLPPSSFRTRRSRPLRPASHSLQPAAIRPGWLAGGHAQNRLPAQVPGYQRWGSVALQHRIGAPCATS